MTTRDYIESNEAYLGRLRQLRQREKENLSEVDFSLFVKRFDRLISKVESELNLAKAMDQSHTGCFLISSTAACGGSVVLGTNLSAFNYNIVPTHYGNAPVSSLREPQIHPRKVSLNTIFIRNDATAFDRPMYRAFAMPA